MTLTWYSYESGVSEFTVERLDFGLKITFLMLLSEILSIYSIDSSVDSPVRIAVSALSEIGNGPRLKLIMPSDGYVEPFLW